MDSSEVPAYPTTPGLPSELEDSFPTNQCESSIISLLSACFPTDKFQVMSWEQYFEKNKGRPVRSLYLQAIELVSASESEELTAIDIGCGAAPMIQYYLECVLEKR